MRCAILVEPFGARRIGNAFGEQNAALSNRQKMREQLIKINALFGSKSLKFWRKINFLSFFRPFL